MKKLAKTTFETPRITQAVYLELENELLAGSPGTTFTNTIEATGHENHEVTGIVDYWE